MIIEIVQGEGTSNPKTLRRIKKCQSPSIVVGASNMDILLRIAWQDIMMTV